MNDIELNYPKELPVCEHREEILAALRHNSVIIVCGDTGSGKTTQLPKMAWEIGIGDWGLGTGENGKRHTRIAVTQPRRLAAVTMAERVAEELKCEVGSLVGFRHRFGRKVSSDTRIEFMTDGVLLAETRFDPLLRAYDTIIVDEAHERSLNIDFLLGILKRILARRRDLKVVVSSATLDAARFSEFFGNAPVISVPGRLYPIEIGYRPPPEDEERDLPRDVAAAVAELPAKDDILVFLPGERDIRETADYLSDVRGGFDDIIPLLASLPASEQRRAFQSSPRRRIILATNVAETSVTIPGIRAVIDSGLARISRYVHRTQVQRLQIEPISQASAKQRTGRCGRLGPGTCFRLYSEEDFNSRDVYTAPEVLRSSLAGVILTMLDLKLGDIEKFPFLDPPKPTMIREGLRELLELGAITHGRKERGSGILSASEEDREIILTDIGRKLAKIPVEPRLARMLLAGSRNAVLPSVIPLVAAMSCDDPRRRPIDEKEKADQAHAKFRVPGSDFLGTLKLWQWWSDETKDLSQSKVRKLCKTNYLSYPKMREWRDLVRQLSDLSNRLGLSTVLSPPPATVPAKRPLADVCRRGGDSTDSDFSARLHMSLLSGLLGRIGKYDEEERDYRGAHGLRFALHPSSVLAKQLKKDKRRETREARTPIPQPRNSATSQPQWIVAGELVDTSRLFARDAAVIDVRWLEPVAGPICKHSYHSPEWDPRSGFVRATEQVTLYGLVIVPARRCDYSRINPVVSREVFIRRGLIDGEFPKPPPAVRANQQLLEALRRRAERSRHPEFFDADRLFVHFDKVIPKDICSADALRKWLRNCETVRRRDAPNPLESQFPRGCGLSQTAQTSDFLLKKSDWWPSETAADRDFPDSLRIAGKTLLLTYRHTPDDPENDGVTCTVRRSDASVLRLWRSDWLVPGLLPEKLLWMLGTLPSALRRILTPLDDSVAILLSMLKPGSDTLENAVRTAVNERWALRIPENAWDWNRLPRHLQMRFRIRDDTTGKTLVLSRDLDEVLSKNTPTEPHQSNNSNNQTIKQFSTWSFGSIPVRQTDRNSGWATVSYPALHDEGDGVTLKLYADPAKAAEAHAAGVTRLFTLALANQLKTPFRLRTVPAAPSLRGADTLDAALYLKDIGYEDDQIAADLLAGAIRETLVRSRPEVRTAEEFERRLSEDRSAIVRTQAEMTAILIESAATATKLHGLMEDERIPEETRDSVSGQIAWLLFRGFPRTVPLATLRHYKRYLRGAQIRLERARLSPAADLKKEVLFAPYWAQYREAAKPEYAAQVNSAALADYRWMLEEYRISLFAQELHTPEPVSPKRLDAKWATV